MPRNDDVANAAAECPCKQLVVVRTRRGDRWGYARNKGLDDRGGGGRGHGATPQGRVRLGPAINCRPHADIGGIIIVRIVKKRETLPLRNQSMDYKGTWSIYGA